MKTLVRIFIIAGLGLALYLANILLVCSMASFAHHSGGKPVAAVCEFMNSWGWLISLLPIIWLLMMGAALLHPQPKVLVEHHLFMASLIALVFTIVFTLSFAAVWPWIPAVVSTSNLPLESEPGADTQP